MSTSQKETKQSKSNSGKKSKTNDSSKEEEFVLDNSNETTEVKADVKPKKEKKSKKIIVDNPVSQEEVIHQEEVEVEEEEVPHNDEEVIQDESSEDNNHVTHTNSENFEFFLQAFINLNSLESWTNDSFKNLTKKKQNDFLAQLKIFDKKKEKAMKDMISSSSSGKKKKVDGPKKDTSNSHVNIKRDTFKEITDFLKLEEGTKISKADLQRGIPACVSSYREAGSTEIIVYSDDGKENKKEFKLINELKVLFDFIVQKMKENGIDEEKYPKGYKANKSSYTEVLSYLSHAFPKVAK